jgi:hypothetical protein
MSEEYRCGETIDLEEMLMNKITHVSINNDGQTEIMRIISDGAYTVVALSAMTGIPKRTLYKWKNGHAKPRKSSNEGVEKIMDIVKNNKKIPKHTSWGYATDEQIEQLKKLGPSVERDIILKQIARQTKLRGKIK